MKSDDYMKNFSIIHRFSIMYHVRKLKEFKISGHQMGYIMHICTEPGLSQEALASYLKLNKGAVAKGIRYLVQEGYIVRRPNEKDRRAYELFPTEKATMLFKEARKTISEFQEILTCGMSEEEEAMFRDLLFRAAENVLHAAGDDRCELEKPGPPPEICRCNASDKIDLKKGDL